MKAEKPGGERQGPWDGELRVGVALEGMLCEIPGVSVPQVVKVEVVCRHAEYKGLEWNRQCCRCC